MFAGVLALVGAVAAALTYATLTERLSYSTVHRRQLDAWAALAAVACLSGIAYGGADARRALEVKGLRSGRVPLVVVRRQHVPDLRLVQTESGRVSDTGQEGRQAALASANAALAVSNFDGPAAASHGGPDGDASYTARSGSRDAWGRVGAGSGSAIAPTPTSLMLPEPTTVGSAEPVHTPTPTLRPLQVATVPRSSWPVRTRLPTGAPATAEPTRIPSATPFCGDPGDIRIRVERLDSTLERTDGQLIVRYSARVRNESRFPATMADIVITALNQAAGSERFGHATRPDVALAPGAVVTLEGALTLTKSPPPFGSTDVCISAVGESCGRRPPYRVIRQCTSVQGL